MGRAECQRRQFWRKRVCSPGHVVGRIPTDPSSAESSLLPVPRRWPNPHRPKFGGIEFAPRATSLAESPLTRVRAHPDRWYAKP